MAHKLVERIDGPFTDNEEGKVAYVMVYTHLNDKVQCVAFNDTGAELAKTDGDIRENLDPSEVPSVAWAYKAKTPLKTPPPKPPLAEQVKRP